MSLAHSMGFACVGFSKQTVHMKYTTCLPCRPVPPVMIPLTCVKIEASHLATRRWAIQLKSRNDKAAKRMARKSGPFIVSSFARRGKCIPSDVPRTAF